MEKLLERYRFFLKDKVRQMIDFSATDQSRGIPVPPVEKPYAPDDHRIDLVAQDGWHSIPSVDLLSAIQNRKSHRHFRAAPVSLDGEVSSSTYAATFKEAYPERFFDMCIGEQNMIGAALGLSCRGKIPFVSTFAAFFLHAFDQIRMSQYSDPNIKCVRSHAGVSIGEDGPSQSKGNRKAVKRRNSPTMRKSFGRPLLKR